MTTPLSMNFIFGIVVLMLGVYEVLSYEIDDKQVLEELFSAQENPSIQVRSLRRQLLKKVQEAIERLEEEENYEALARWNILPDKRNLEALARAGYIKTVPEEEEEDANYKRSIANLAKNGQLPRRQEEQKRGLESLARNGDLRLRNVQTLLENLNDKRHLGSLIKNYDYQTVGKKSLSSLAKSGDLNYKHMQYKRSPVPSPQKTATDSNNQVRNTISKQSSENLLSIGDQKRLLDDKIMAGSISKRGKRDADYYYENDENYSPGFQNIYDYDDVIQDLHSAYPEVGKRFLGSVVRSGYRPPSLMRSQYLSPEKRHIGSLARLGWLPSFRHIRRFNRSGRSTNNDSCRASSSDGQAEINSNSQDPTLLLKINNKYSYKTPGDTDFLKRVFYHPNVSKFF